MIKLTLDDSRRLTGKGLVWDKSGAILDAFVSGIELENVVAVWQRYTRLLLDAVNWQEEDLIFRMFEDGVSLAISAPVDALYAACELNEAAWAFTCAELTAADEMIHNTITIQRTGVLADETNNEVSEENIQQCVIRITQLIAEEQNPELVQLIELAKKHDVVCLYDDDEFSLGYGKTAQVWPIDGLPDPTSIQWQEYQAIPIALVTGTNGKSTSVRILSSMIEKNGRNCGVTSTDFIRVGSNIIDHGDYSGPGGARILLRHKDTEAAVLEVARGGILRRGLPIEHADVALITNVAEDHLGQYGINTLIALGQTKMVVNKAVDSGELVLNADDELLVELASGVKTKICWFALDETNKTIQNHRLSNGNACFLRDGVLIYATGSNETEIVAVNDIPMTFNGAAFHNIQNALGAIGVAKSLRVDNDSIKSALKSFSSDVEDNPGRGNQFEINGAQVVMDFAHNAHSLDAMATTMSNIPANRKFLMISMAGDRSNAEIVAATNSALAMKPNYLIAADLPMYLRGRQIGEVAKLIIDTAIEKGMSAENIYRVDNPLKGAELIVQRLQPSDLALILALSDRDEIIELLNH